MLNSEEKIEVMSEDKRIKVIPAWKWCLEI